MKTQKKRAQPYSALADESTAYNQTQPDWTVLILIFKTNITRRHMQKHSQRRDDDNRIAHKRVAAKVLHTCKKCSARYIAKSRLRLHMLHCHRVLVE